MLKKPRTLGFLGVSPQKKSQKETVLTPVLGFWASRSGRTTSKRLPKRSRRRWWLGSGVYIVGGFGVAEGLWVLSFKFFNVFLFVECFFFVSLFFSFFFSKGSKGGATVALAWTTFSLKETEEGSACAGVPRNRRASRTLRWTSVCGA